MTQEQNDEVPRALREEFAATPQGRRQAYRMRLMEEVDEALRMAETSGLAQRSRLLAEGLDEHTIDHVTAGLISQLNGFYLNRMDEP